MEKTAKTIKTSSEEGNSPKHPPASLPANDGGASHPRPIYPLPSLPPRSNSASPLCHVHSYQSITVNGDVGSTFKLPLRVFFIPWFATGHIIPLVDLARLFAVRGVESIVLVTPANAAIIAAMVDSATASGLLLRTLLYPFPSAEAGLPPGIENISALPPSESYKIDLATPLVRPEHDRLLRLHRPHAIVADIHFPWTASIARDLGVPRISFHAIGLFPMCVMDSLIRNQPHLAVSGDDEFFLVPDLPHPVYLTRSELPDFLRGESAITGVLEDVIEAEYASMGVLVNSFSEMELAYADYYQMPSWLVGPVGLASGVEFRKGYAERGGSDEPSAAANRDRCLEWLDSNDLESVIYLCFGSWSHFAREQLQEMALGLEASGHPFLWVVRDDGYDWIPEGFDKRVGGRGLIVNGWAPQMAVLEHAAVGGFLTHCGWNSVLEGVTAGLPMVTWPLSTEQFINEKLVVEVLRIGVQVSAGYRSTAEEELVIVGAEEIARAVRRIMGGGEEEEEEEAERRRRRAKVYKEKARAAVKECGSSFERLSELIAEIRDWNANQKDFGEAIRNYV